MELVPVDSDPFVAGQTGGATQPLKLVPVDHNPFEAQSGQDENKPSEFSKLYDFASSVNNPFKVLGKIGELADPTSIPRTALDQSMQGATFGFGDEITDRLGAAGASLYTGEKYGDLLKEARAASSHRMADQLHDNPITTIGANIGGGALTGGAIAQTKAGGVINNLLRDGVAPQATSALGRAGNLASKAVLGGAAGAANGALYGAGSANEGERMAGAGQGAVVGGAIGATLPLAARALGSLSETKTPVTADQIKQQANAAYQEAEQKGGTLKGWFTNKFLDEINTLKPQTPAGQLIGGDSPSTQLIEKMQGLKNKRMTLSEAQEVDELLGDLVDGHTDIKGISKEGKKILDIQTTLRNMIDKVSPQDINGGTGGFEALKKGRELWSKQARLRDIEKIIARAELMENPATGIKTGFRTLATNPSRLRGYSGAERRAIQKAAESGMVPDILRTFGSRLIPIVTAASGGGLGGTITAQAMSMASRGAATRVQLNKAANVANMIAGQTTAPGNLLLSHTIQQNALPALTGIEAGVLNRASETVPAAASHALPAAEIPRALPAELPAPGVPHSALENIQGAEGTRQASYQDTTGNTTIGQGFNMDSPSAKKIWKMSGIKASFEDAKTGKINLTPEQIHALTAQSFDIAMNDAKSVLPNFDKQPQNVQDALVEMSYQLGKPRLSRFKQTLGHVENGDYEQAAQSLLKSRYARQTPGRVQRLAEMLTT